MQINSKEEKRGLLIRNWVRSIVSKIDVGFGTNIASKLVRKSLYLENYDDLCKEIINRKPNSEKAIPGMFVGWDNTPRRGSKGRVCIGSTPEKFGKYLKLQIQNVKKNYKTDMLFIFAWNEWAEGGYLEPDETNRYGYLEEIKKAMEDRN